MMANLPKIRLIPHTPAFYHTVCYYFGPYKVKIGRNKTTKYYRISFTYLNTHVVHLELATDCSMMELIQALCRSFAVRGYPALIQSDNGTQVVGEANKLCEMIQGWNKKKLQEYAAHRRMNVQNRPQTCHWKNTQQAGWWFLSLHKHQHIFLIDHSKT